MVSRGIGIRKEKKIIFEVRHEVLMEKKKRRSRVLKTLFWKMAIHKFSSVQFYPGRPDESVKNRPKCSPSLFLFETNTIFFVAKSTHGI
jgi:hypothetical protein